MISENESIPRIKVLILLRSLDQMAGGVERSAIQLANRLQTNGCEVILLSLDTMDSCAFYEIDPEVNWIKLGETSPKVTASFSEKIRRLDRLRKVVKATKAEVIVSFQGGATRQAIISTFLTKCDVIAAERESLTKYSKNIAGNSKKYKHFVWLIFVSRIQVFFDSNKAMYPFFLKRKIRVIPNFFTEELSYGRDASKPRSSYYLFVGRFEGPKNPEIFLNALKLSGRNGIMIGAGSLEVEIQNQVITTDLVQILPPNSNIYDFISRAKAIVNVSDWEGFPNVVLEALVLGTPVIGFSETSGVSNLITHLKNGFLCEGKPNSEVLAKLFTEFDFNLIKSEEIIKTSKNYHESFVLPIWINTFLELQNK